MMRLANPKQKTNKSGEARAMHRNTGKLYNSVALFRTSHIAGMFSS
jgi:hypothetical protein